MVCPIIVEDLSSPRQMLVEMLCEEQGFFLEIADIIRGLGLTILIGVMEARNDKVWVRFTVEVYTICDVAANNLKSLAEDFGLEWAMHQILEKYSFFSLFRKEVVTDGNGNGTPPGGVWQTQGADLRKTNGGSTNPQPYNRCLKNNAPRPVVAPPLQHGWQWGARAGAHVTPNQGSRGPYDFVLDFGNQQHQSDVEDDDDLIGEDDDYDLMSDEFDSDCSVKSHDTRKKHPWFKHFFEVLDKLTLNQISKPSRQWHCPACKNGPGAINWYRGLHPLMAHAKTKGAKRVKIHKELAEVLDEELIRRGTIVIPAGEAFGKWTGLREKVSDKDIVWPPMVVVMNTQLEMDENDEKWIGMGNQELLDYFSEYAKAIKARHSYGPKGHRGMSILIFESTAVGYLEAEHLDKHFSEQSTGRHDWEHGRVLFKAGGPRQLYGYMARKDDLDIFNKHCQVIVACYC